MLKFLIYLSLLTALIAGALYTGHHLGFFPLPTYGWQIIFYMAFSTAVVVNILQRNAGPVLFTQLYLLTIVIKMLSGSIVILIIIYTNHTAASENAALFIICYILFTALEVFFLYRNVNRHTNKMD